MRYVTGAVGVVAAALFVGYSAVITYNVAHDMTTEFKQLAGYAAAGIVLWECLGLLFVRQCWQNGARWLAAGGLALVVAAAVYTARLDLRFHVAGQADMAASRDASVETRKMTREELAKARARRDTLQQTKRLTEAQEDELNAIGKRISELEGRFDTQIVNAGGMPEAGWASRMLSKVSDDEVWWQDALMVFGLVFWALARMVAMPLAVASMGTLRKPEEAALAPEATVTPSASLPAIPRPRKDALATIAGVDVRKDIGQTYGIAAEVSDKADVRPAEHSEKFVSPNIDPDGPGTPANLPKISDSSPADGDTEDPKVVRPEQWKQDTQSYHANLDWRLEKAKKHKKPDDATALHWMYETTRVLEDDERLLKRWMPSRDLHPGYKKWCTRLGKKPLSQRRFSTVLAGELDLPKLRGADGKRKSAVMLFPLELVNHSAKRKVA